MKDRILVVDMDDSFLKTDLFYEMILRYVRDNLFNIFKILFIFIKKNRLFLKNYLAENVSLDFDRLPVNDHVSSWIKKNKKNYSKVILCSGSPQKFVEGVSSKSRLFDEIFGSTKTANLTGIEKIHLLKKKGYRDFDYIGDSFKDIAIWREAKNKFCVNFSQIKCLFFALVFDIKFDKNFKQPFNKYIKSFLNVFRINQWVKNFLLIIHFLILGNIGDFVSIKSALSGFFLFCFASSFGYVFNDLLDLESDRAHVSKKNRPFASGDISVSKSIYAFLILLLLGGFVSISLLPMYYNFVILVILYMVLSLIYTVYFKKIKFFDCFALSFFFTYRILCGSFMDLHNNISIFLLVFSFFIFYSFANLKRFVEIKNSNHLQLIGRPYKSTDLKLIFFQGVAPLIISIAFLFGILDQLIFIKNNNIYLYFSFLFFYFWTVYIWYKAIVSTMDFDLVTFSYDDKFSLLFIITFLLLFLVHNFL